MPDLRRRTFVALVSMMLFSGLLALIPAPAAAAVDEVTLWRGDLSAQATVFNDSALAAIMASDGVTIGGTSWANVSDSAHPSDHINVTIYDDGTHGDIVAGDGAFTGTFTIRDDRGSNGVYTDNATDVIDVAEGGTVNVTVDLAGDGGAATAHAVSDFTPPKLTIHTQTGGFFNDIFHLNITAEDDHLNTSSAGYYIDGTNFTAFNTTIPGSSRAPSWNFIGDLPLSDLTEDEHEANVRVADDAGNIQEGSISFTVDRTAPEMFIPFEGGFVSGTITITVTIIIISEGEAPVVASSVTYSIDFGTPVAFDQISETVYQANVLTQFLTEGPHVLSVNSMDSAGNEGRDVWDIIVDNTVPTIDLDGLVVDELGYITLTTTITDTYLDQGTVMARMDSGDWTEFDCTNDTSGQYSWEWNRDAITPGSHTTWVQAKDQAGNSMTLEIPFEKPTGPPDCENCKVLLEKNGDVTLDWDDAAGADYYRIYTSSWERPTDRYFSNGHYEGDTSTSTYKFQRSLVPKYVAIYPVKDGAYGKPCIVEIVIPDPDYEDISVSDPVVKNPDAKEGDHLEIETDVTNSGPVPIEVEVQVYVDGEPLWGATPVTVPANSTERISISYPSIPEGLHDIQVVVTKPSELPGNNTPPPPPPDEITSSGITTIDIPPKKTSPPDDGGNPVLDPVINTYDDHPSECNIILALFICGGAAATYIAWRRRKDHEEATDDFRERYRTPDETSYPTRPEEPPTTPSQPQQTPTPTDSSVASEPITPIVTPAPTMHRDGTDGGTPVTTDGDVHAVTPPSGRTTAPEGPKIPSTPETPTETPPPAETAPSQTPTRPPVGTPTGGTETTTPTAPPKHTITPPPGSETAPEGPTVGPTTTPPTGPTTATTGTPGATMPPVVPVASVPRRGGPCDGIKEQWDAMKVEAERLRTQAEAAQARIDPTGKAAQDARRQAGDARQDATEARKEANDKKKEMDKKKERLDRVAADRDQLLKTICNTVPGASTTPQAGWDEYIGSGDQRSGLYPGRVWFAPGDAAKQEFNETIEKWRDELKAAKEREDQAREEFEGAKREYEDADREADRAEAEADNKEAEATRAEAEHQQTMRDAETYRQQANAAIDRANRFADQWRQCIRERLDRLARAVEEAANDADRAAQDAARGDNPAAREDAAARAETSRRRADQANDQLDSEADRLEDPELRGDIRNARRRGDTAEGRANGAASRARGYSRRMPRVCQDGETNKKKFTRRRTDADETREVEVSYNPHYGANMDGSIDGEEAARAMADYFNLIGKAIGIMGKIVPSEGGIVKIPLSIFGKYMEAGEAMIDGAVGALKEHQQRLGFGDLTVKIPVWQVTEHWEKRFLCINGAWGLQETVKVREDSIPTMVTARLNNVAWKDIPKMIARTVGRYK